MKALAIQFLTGLVTGLLFAIAGYAFGVHNTNNTWHAKQAKTEREQTAKYKAEVARGNEAAGTYLRDLADKEDRYEKLNDQFQALRKRMPLAVPARVAAPGAAAAPDAPAGCEAVAQRVEQPAGDGAVPHLSLGAVWMWNSALAGRDAPAGACDAAAAAGGPEAACAQDSGLDLEDAWANQEDNARSCAIDRQRFQSLIEFLKGRTP